MHRQGINQQAGKQVTITTLDNPICGTTEDTNTHWVNAPTVRGSVPLANWCTFVDTAADGSSFKMLDPGVYLCSFNFACFGTLSPAYVGGISVDAPLATRQANPHITAAGVVASAYFGGSAVGSSGSISCSYPVRITGSMAASASLGVIRFGFSDGSNGTPSTGAVNRTLCWASITKIAELTDASLT